MLSKFVVHSQPVTRKPRSGVSLCEGGGISWPTLATYPSRRSMRGTLTVVCPKLRCKPFSVAWGLSVSELFYDSTELLFFQIFLGAGLFVFCFLFFYHGHGAAYIGLRKGKSTRSPVPRFCTTYLSCHVSQIRGQRQKVVALMCIENTTTTTHHSPGSRHLTRVPKRYTCG